MRKPVGVIAAMVVLGLMTAFGLFLVLFTLLVTLFVHMPPRAPPAWSESIPCHLLPELLLYFCFLRMDCRRSLPDAFVGPLLHCGARHIDNDHLRRNVFLEPLRDETCVVPHGRAQSTGRFAFGRHLRRAEPLYAGIALIGVWWAVYFNLKHVREAFANARLR